jgi:hypothetical protein
VADSIEGSGSNKAKQRALLYSFFMMPFITALAGACFLISSFYLIKDRAAVKATVTGHTDENRTLLNHGDYDEDSTTDNDVSNDVLNGDVKNSDEANDIVSDDVVSDNITCDDVTVDDVTCDDVIVDTKGQVQSGHDSQIAMSNDTLSDSMETKQPLVRV